MLHRLSMATRNVLGDLRDGARFEMVIFALVLAISVSVFVPGVRNAITDASRMVRALFA